MKEKVYKLLLISSTLAVVGIIFTIMLFIYVSFDLPDVKGLMDYSPPVPSQILSNDGEILLTIGKEKRDIVEIKDVPKLLIGAFLAAEDNNFEHHHGVDFGGMFRALVVNFKAGRIVQGGSTITQQVAKMTLLSRERSVTRKIKDFLLAQKIEKIFSKDEVLYFFLNHIYLGGGYYGVKTAFRGYFDKDLNEGTVAEFALIAGLIVAPSKYSPYLNPQYAKIRQKYVLGRMVDSGRITREEYDKAIQEEVVVRIRQNSQMLAPYFTDWVRQIVIGILGEEEFLTGGYKIVTTLEYELQKKAELYTLNGVKNLDKRQGFKGALLHFSKEDEKDNFIIEERKKILEKKSHFFYLTKEGDKNFENSFSKDEYNERKKQRHSKLKQVGQKFYWPGISEDQVADLINTGENYQALVEKVDDQQRLIYISVGGISGVISYDYFKWAHERLIDKNKHYYSYVQRPGQIVKVGDVILVKIIGEAKPIWSYLSDSLRQGLVDKNIVEILQTDRYLICELDQDPEVEGALVAINVTNNHVISLVGGNSFEKSQFNRAIQAERQTGSAIKPIIYASALEHNYTPASIIFDSPEALGGADESLQWKPHNYDNTFKGPMTFRRALELSRNIPTVKIAEDIRLSTLINFMKRLGLKVDGKFDLTLVLGSYGVTLLELVSTYSIFPKGGERVVPKFILSITDRFGKEYVSDSYNQNNQQTTKESSELANSSSDEIEKESLSATSGFAKNLTKDRVYDPRLAYIMSNLMRGVIQNGTGRSARGVGSYIGGKTGTTNDFIDAWFVGFSSNVSVGTWVGFDNNQTLGWPETGAMAALPIWKDFMKDILKKYGDTEFRTPPGIINVLINKETGKLASSADSSENTMIESFVEGTSPAEGGGGGSGPKVGGDDTEEGQKEEENGDVYNEDDFYMHQ